MRITKIHCDRCGGEEISCDAAARWCEESRAWEISGLFDDTDCDDCGGECGIVRVDLDVIEESEPEAPAQSPNATARAMVIVDMLAGMTTPYDDLPEDASDHDRDQAADDYSNDCDHDDAVALWELIDRAREIKTMKG